MSTILKALKRLDEQRRADASPRTLEEQVLAGGRAQRAPTARRNKWLFVAAGAASVLLVVGASRLLTRGDRAQPQASAPPEQPPATAAAPIAPAIRGREMSRGAPIAGTELDAAMRASLSASSARVETAPGSMLPARGDQPEGELVGVAVPERVAAFDTSSSAVSEGRPPLVAQMPRSLARERLARNAADSHPPESGGPPVTRRESSPAEAAPAAPEPAHEGPAQRTPEPESSAAAAAPRPEVFVERTQWHPAAEKRSATVRQGESGEPHELREGDLLDGVVVKEIHPSGVLFVYEGVEFKRGVGER